MREIKFRAWDKDNELMIYSEGNTNDDFTFIVEKGGLQFYYINTDRHLMESNSINMQYTGLKDKNGKEIYEGDVLIWYINDKIIKAPVYYDNRQALFWMGKEIKMHGGLVLNDWMRGEYEVIGNIYEHPHLLEDRE